ncbi:MAG: nuclear transport factor 2 family protein [Thermodesulfobacteriota bacterium]
MAETQTENVLMHHLGSFGAGDIEGLLSDYTDDSIIITPDGVFRGLSKIKGLFEKFLSEIVPVGSDFVLSKKIIEDDIAYIVWSAESVNYKIPLGTDTFIVRDGKIVTQTVGMLMEEK